MSTTLDIPDAHAPFEHQDMLAFLREVKRKHRPDYTVCLGDEGDGHGLGNYDHDPDGHSAGDEYLLMIEHLKPLYEMFPNVQCCHSNHTSRPFRRAAKYGIPSVYLREYRDFMQAPKGWSWHASVEIDGVRHLHGEGYSGPLGALKCAQAHMQPVVIGHLHSYAGVLFNANPRHLFWGMNAGCLIDRDAYAFAYGKHMAAKPILGCGLVRNRVPTFLPMNLNRNGRWTGDL